MPLYLIQQETQDLETFLKVKASTWSKGATLEQIVKTETWTGSLYIALRKIKMASLYGASEEEFAATTTAYLGAAKAPTISPYSHALAKALDRCTAIVEVACTALITAHPSASKDQPGRRTSNHKEDEWAFYRISYAFETVGSVYGKSSDSRSVIV